MVNGEKLRQFNPAWVYVAVVAFVALVGIFLGSNGTITGAAPGVDPISIYCGQSVVLPDQVVCAVHLQGFADGIPIESATVTVNVSNRTGQVVVQSTATDIGNGDYRVNFSVQTQGGYIVSVRHEGTSFGDATPVMVRSGFGAAKVMASGTLFFPESKIVVDALFVDQDGQPIRQAACNLTLFDQNQSVMVENATMAEFSFGGISHYVYNRSDISSISANMTDGAYFGHVRCQQPGTSGITTFGRVSFEVRFFNITSTSGSTDFTPVLSSINDTRLLLQRLIERQTEFSQEQVFLVTDAFNQMSSLSAEVLQGSIPPQEALERVVSINHSVAALLAPNSKAVFEPVIRMPSAQVPGVVGGESVHHTSLESKVSFPDAVVVVVLFVLVLVYAVLRRSPDQE